MGEMSVGPVSHSPCVVSSRHVALVRLRQRLALTCTSQAAGNKVFHSWLGVAMAPMVEWGGVEVGGVSTQTIPIAPGVKPGVRSP